MGASPVASMTLGYLQSSAMGSSSVSQQTLGSRGTWASRRRSLARLLVFLLAVCLVFEALRLWVFTPDTAVTHQAHKRRLLFTAHPEPGHFPVEPPSIDYGIDAAKEFVNNADKGPRLGEGTVDTVTRIAFEALQKCKMADCHLPESYLHEKFQKLHDEFKKSHNASQTDEDWKKQQIDEVIPAYIESFRPGSGPVTVSVAKRAASTLITVRVTPTDVGPSVTNAEPTLVRHKRDDGRPDAFNRQNSETHSGSQHSKREGPVDENGPENHKPVLEKRKKSGSKGSSSSGKNEKTSVSKASAAPATTSAAVKKLVESATAKSLTKSHHSAAAAGTHAKTATKAHLASGSAHATKHASHGKATATLSDDTATATLSGVAATTSKSRAGRIKELGAYAPSAYKSQQSGESSGGSGAGSYIGQGLGMAADAQRNGQLDGIAGRLGFGSGNSKPSSAHSGGSSTGGSAGEGTVADGEATGSAGEDTAMDEGSDAVDEGSTASDGYGGESTAEDEDVSATPTKPTNDESLSDGSDSTSSDSVGSSDVSGTAGDTTQDSVGESSTTSSHGKPGHGSSSSGFSSSKHGSGKGGQSTKQSPKGQSSGSHSNRLRARSDSSLRRRSSGTFSDKTGSPYLDSGSQSSTAGSDSIPPSDSGASGQSGGPSAGYGSQTSAPDSAAHSLVPSVSVIAPTTPTSTSDNGHAGGASGSDIDDAGGDSAGSDPTDSGSYNDDSGGIGESKFGAGLSNKAVSPSSSDSDSKAYQSLGTSKAMELSVGKSSAQGDGSKANAAGNDAMGSAGMESSGVGGSDFGSGMDDPTAVGSEGSGSFGASNSTGSDSVGSSSDDSPSDLDSGDVPDKGLPSVQDTSSGKPSSSSGAGLGSSSHPGIGSTTFSQKNVVHGGLAGHSLNGTGDSSGATIPSTSGGLGSSPPDASSTGSSSLNTADEEATSDSETSSSSSASTGHSGGASGAHSDTSRDSNQAWPVTESPASYESDGNAPPAAGSMINARIRLEKRSSTPPPDGGGPDSGDGAPRKDNDETLDLPDSDGSRSPRPSTDSSDDEQSRKSDVAYPLLCLKDAAKGTSKALFAYQKTHRSKISESKALQHMQAATEALNKAIETLKSEKEDDEAHDTPSTSGSASHNPTQVIGPLEDDGDLGKLKKRSPTATSEALSSQSKPPSGSGLANNGASNGGSTLALWEKVAANAETATLDYSKIHPSKTKATKELLSKMAKVSKKIRKVIKKLKAQEAAEGGSKGSASKGTATSPASPTSKPQGVNTGTAINVKRSPILPDKDDVTAGPSKGPSTSKASTPSKPDYKELPKGRRTVAFAIDRLLSSSQAALSAFQTTNRKTGDTSTNPVYQSLQAAQASILKAKEANLATTEAGQGAGDSGSEGTEFEDETSSESESSSCVSADSACSKGGVSRVVKPGQSGQSSSPDSMSGSDGGGDIGTLADADAAAAVNAPAPGTGGSSSTAGGSGASGASDSTGSSGTGTSAAGSQAHQPKPGSGFGRNWGNKDQPGRVGQ